MSTINATQKKRGRPPVDSEELRVRMERSLIDRVEAFAESQGIKSRPEAVRRLTQHGLDYLRSRE